MRGEKDGRGGERRERRREDRRGAEKKGGEEERGERRRKEKRERRGGRRGGKGRGCVLSCDGNKSKLEYIYVCCTYAWRTHIHTYIQHTYFNRW